VLIQMGPPLAAVLDLSAPAGVDVVLRPALPADMDQAAALVNAFAAQNLMLPKTTEQLVRMFREFIVAVDDTGRVLGCGGLRVFTPTLAEIVSLAVHPATQGMGLGARIVDRLVDDAALLGITTVFALTLRDGFFHRSGFRTVEKEMFPAKVWSDCRNCPKLDACDEIAVVKEVRSATCEVRGATAPPRR
jgi:amino-acid N-acetyltransferase